MRFLHLNHHILLHNKKDSTKSIFLCQNISVLGTRYRIFFYIPGVELRGVLFQDLLLFGLGKELHDAEGPILDVLDNDDTNGIIAFLI